MENRELREMPANWKAFRSNYSQYPSKPCDGVCIPLTMGRHALIDAEDYPKVYPYAWYLLKKYANHNVLNHMHQFIFGRSELGYIDHINGNGTDNRKSNLRECTQSENMCNRGAQRNNKTGYKGVKNTKFGTYEARIGFRKKYKYLGSHKLKPDAAMAYDRAALEIHGEYATLNFPCPDCFPFLKGE